MGKQNRFTKRPAEPSILHDMIQLSDLLTDHQHYHSDFQMDSFITVRSGGTLYGCYKQALRELDKRTRGLVGLYAERELLMIDIEEFELSSNGKSREARRKAIELARKRFQLSETDDNISDTEREFLRFYGQAVAIREALEAQGVSFPLDAETRDRLDREMWSHRLRCMAAVDMLTAHQLSAQTIEFLHACPPEIRRELFATVLNKDPTAHAQWYLNDSPAVPEPKLIAAQPRNLIACYELPHSPEPLPSSLPAVVIPSRLANIASVCESANPAQNGTG